MNRIFGAYAYSDAPRAHCWWDETIAAPDWPALQGEVRADVAIIGGGFTGLSAALHLAESGASVAVLEANGPGWGASGRNGGFCCLGGSKLSSAKLTRIYGSVAADEYARAEHDAVALVSGLLERHGIDADRHSDGEVQLAHTAHRMRKLRTENASNPDTDLFGPDELAQRGLNGPFFGGVTEPTGFALNPRKYLFGLAHAAERAGAHLFQRSPVQRMIRRSGQYCLTAGQGQVLCDSVIIATNGYSSEDMPGWLSARYMPAQSTVLVTRPLTDAELAAQGWTSLQMAYDTRKLLHYFRLMPDRRFLFGMRGGLMSSPSAQARSIRATRRDFETMFPAWRNVPSDHSWSGMVCLAANRVPYAGPVPEMPGVFAGLAYHGNGVAMGSYTGRALAGQICGRADIPPTPQIMQTPMRRFPFGPARRLIIPALYAGLWMRDLL